MYYADFDDNGTSETIMAIEKNGEYFPLDGFDMLAGQMPALKKKFTSYHSFAGKPIDEIFSSDKLKKAKVYETHELASGYLRNENGRFSFIRFPVELQIAPIMAQLVYDFDGDGKEEVLLGGNYFGVQPFHGRYASFEGALVKNENEIIPGSSTGLKLINQSVRHFNVITLNKQKYLIVTINNEKAQVYKLNP
jgi:hypothetical protein